MRTITQNRLEAKTPNASQTGWVMIFSFNTSFSLLNLYCVDTFSRLKRYQKQYNLEVVSCASSMYKTSRRCYVPVTGSYH